MPDSSPELRPPVPISPGAYLPRITYRVEGEPEAEDQPARLQSATADGSTRAGRAAKKPGKDVAKSDETTADEPKRVLKEATPELDTIEARRKIRIIVGCVVASVFLLAVWVMFSLFTQSTQPSPVESGPETIAGPDPRVELERRETLAIQLLEEARGYAKQGQDTQATQRLERLTAAFGATEAATEAREALKRQQQRLPLFPGGPILNVRAPEVDETPTHDPQPETKAIEISEKPAPPVEEGASGAQPIVALTPPIMPPEPYRETGLPRERAQIEARELPAGFRPRPEAGVHSSGWPNEITCDRDGSSLVLVPAGEFLMGSRLGRAAERPEHQVMMSTYYIDQHEVTNAQFDIYLESIGKPTRGVPNQADRPVVSINWEEARAYAGWAGKVLPTEAQWEKAARTTDGRKYPWGAEKPIWQPARAPRQIDAVASFPRDLSPYGVFDTSGNAWEWTNDWFEARAYQNGKTTLWVDPKGPPKPLGRNPEVAVRGGSSDWDVAWRSSMGPDARLPYLGFRGVLSVEAKTQPAPDPATPNNSKPKIDTRKIVPF